MWSSHRHQERKGYHVGRGWKGEQQATNNTKERIRKSELGVNCDPSWKVNTEEKERSGKYNTKVV